MNTVNFFKRTAAALMIALVAFAGCEKEESKIKFITTDKETLIQGVFADQTSGVDVTFVTGGAWSSSISEIVPNEGGAASWLSVTPDHGDAAGEYTVSVVLEPNTTGVLRSAAVDLMCNGTVEHFTVSQFAYRADGTVPDIVVTDESALIATAFADQTAGTTPITFTSLGAWTSRIADGAASWLAITPDHGDTAGEYDVAVSLKPNTTGAERTGAITITCNGTDMNVTVIQMAAPDGTEEMLTVEVEDGSAYNPRIDEVKMLVGDDAIARGGYVGGRFEIPLPGHINSLFLRKVIDVTEGLDVTGNLNAKMTPTVTMVAYKSGEKVGTFECRSPEKDKTAQLAYVDSAISIVGSDSGKEDNITYTESYNLSFKKGWNFMYHTITETVTSMTSVTTTENPGGMNWYFVAD
jgi:hypothetical protein